MWLCVGDTSISTDGASPCTGTGVGVKVGVGAPDCFSDRISRTPRQCSLWLSPSLLSMTIEVGWCDGVCVLLSLWILWTRDDPLLNKCNVRNECRGSLFREGDPSMVRDLDHDGKSRS